MRRLTFLAVGLVVLATAGLAVARGLEATKSIKSVAGTFTAATVQPIGKATSCTTSDGKTLVTAKARYSGVAAGDGNLAGAITFEARIVANATDNIGVVDGKATALPTSPTARDVSACASRVIPFPWSAAAARVCLIARTLRFRREFFVRTPAASDRPDAATGPARSHRERTTTSCASVRDSR